MCFALGLALVFGVMRIINFAHGELYMLGAYSAYVGTFFLSPVTGAGAAYAASFLIAAIVTGTLGALIFFGIVERLKARPLTVFIATLALSYILQTIVVQIFGPVGQSLTSPLKGVLQIGGGFIPWSRVFVVVAITVLALSLWLLLGRTAIGRSIRAVAQNPRGALLQGVNVKRIGLFTVVLGSILAGLAGVIMAPITGLNPFMGAVALWKAFIIIIVGGIGSVWGAAAAAIIFGTIDTLMSTFGAGRFLALVNAGIMLFVLSVMPSGLFGEKD
jgi:branched-subunit amino acid ABC-type transport system permease component